MVDVSIWILSLLVQKLIAGVTFMVVVLLDPLIFLVGYVNYIGVAIKNMFVLSVILNILRSPEVHWLLHRVLLLFCLIWILIWIWLNKLEVVLR